ncbi:MAG TPA: LLM class flavin-dependent oxidoreductase, partial [Candidatus Saccharimonadales bacterium]|nr:LLM class flavin-dependent oxidoreductase [Candidatus Saccharimonadales bacterium]
ADHEEAGYHEAASVLAGLAAVTARVELGTLVFSTSFRAPALLAKIAATIDAIAGGRLILGVGCGWHEPEYQAFGFPFDHRVGRFDEALQIIAPLVRGERVTFEGRWNAVTDSVLLPPPVRPIPILVAAKGERMLQLTVRHANQWNAAWFGRPNDRYHGRVADLRKALAAEARDPATLEITVGLMLDPGSSIDRAGAPETLPPDARVMADVFADWSALGVGHVQVRCDSLTDTVIDAVVEARRRFVG